MSKAVSKPFWLHPPWYVLFDLVRLHKLRPWDVDISSLLSSFVGEMKKRGYMDFGISGTALLSSCIILRIQSELVMKLEEPPQPPEPKPQEQIPPPIQLPFRYEFTSTTLDSLVESLAEALKGGIMEAVPQTAKPLIPTAEIFERLDDFAVEVESRMTELYQRLCRAWHGKAAVFSKLVAGMPQIEVIRTFLLLLYLASRNMINLSQEEEFGEIYVEISGKPEDGRPVVTV
ncbi:MAG: segregation/condensation protein A [Candidatus Bathyarchaeia archaeon]